MNTLTRKIVDRLLSGGTATRQLERIHEVLNSPPVNSSGIEPLTYNLNEASRKLGLSRTAFYMLRQRGLIKAVNIGGLLRIRATDIEGMVRNANHVEGDNNE